MRKDNSKIISKFWYQRLSEEIKKFGIKTSPKEQKIDGRLDADALRVYVQTFMDAVLKGIGNDIPKELISTSFEESKNYENKAIFYLYVDIKSTDKFPSSGNWKPPCFYMHIFDDTVTQCYLSYGKNRYLGDVFSRNLKCDNPEAFGKIMAALYASRDEDIENCKKEIAKSDKIQQLVGIGLRAIIENHLKTLELPWAVSEGANGKVKINIKYTGRKVLTLTVQSATFDNDYQKLLNAIDMIDQLIRKDKVDLSIRGEKSSDFIEWHIPGMANS